MEREIENKLVNWKAKPSHKPLIIRGARQIGKSWIVEHFGKKHFKGKLHIVNFEKSSHLNSIFDYNFDVKRIKIELEIHLGLPINAEQDLLFFDEIQACPRALMALRYFYEDMPTLHIIAAGSLLDFALKDISYPVGRVEHLEMHPMTFSEFLKALGKDQLADIIGQAPHQLSASIEHLLKEQLSHYFLVGGMPACVKEYIDTGSIVETQKIQDDLLFTFKEDFKKYDTKVSVDCLNDVLQALSQNISNQVKYTKLSDRFSGPTIKKAFELLKTARIVHQVQNVSLAGLPLLPSGIQFKPIFLDIGLWLRISNLPLNNLLGTENILAAFKGAMAEQFVGQELKVHIPGELCYWANTEKSTMSEIDFVISVDGEILPIEVKYGKNGSLKSMHYALQKHQNIKKAVILSNAAFGTKDQLHFLPIYWAGELGKNFA